MTRALAIAAALGAGPMPGPQPAKVIERTVSLSFELGPSQEIAIETHTLGSETLAIVTYEPRHLHDARPLRESFLISGDGVVFRPEGDRIAYSRPEDVTVTRIDNGTALALVDQP